MFLSIFFNYEYRMEKENAHKRGLSIIYFWINEIKFIYMLQRRYEIMMNILVSNIQSIIYRNPANFGNELAENPHINQSIVKQVALHVCEINVYVILLFFFFFLFWSQTVSLFMRYECMYERVALSSWLRRWLM